MTATPAARSSLAARRRTRETGRHPCQGARRLLGAVFVHADATEVAGLQGNRRPLLRSAAVPFENCDDITTGCPESVRVLVPLGEDVVEPLP